jgi:benzoyl-CoA reductase/2-hydroxyglutaryl-CoA dehydratase subunit BcrC/BadD/HgdB
MIRIAGFTSNTIPWEILRAAGYSPRLLEHEPGPTPIADRFMEDVFDPRIRVIFDRLCSGEWSGLQMVVIPRTSEQEHKLYLYLREAARAHFLGVIPELYLYNLLHTRAPESYSYGLDRTHQMVHDFKVPDGALREAIAESNRARAAVRQLHQKRRDGLLEGSAAAELIRGFYTEARATFADRVFAHLEARSSPVAGDRPRILIKGVPLDGTLLHRVVEEAGGYVVAEDDWRGSRAAGDQDVRTDRDPATAIFEKYYYDEMSPRIQPSSDRDTWFHREVGTARVDGVLFYIPLEDDVVGWDYPRHHAFLEARRVPSVVVREICALAEVAAFVVGLRRGLLA